MYRESVLVLQKLWRMSLWVIAWWLYNIVYFKLLNTTRIHSMRWPFLIQQIDYITCLQPYYERQRIFVLKLKDVTNTDILQWQIFDCIDQKVPSTVWTARGSIYFNTFSTLHAKIKGINIIPFDNLLQPGRYQSAKRYRPFACSTNKTYTNQIQPRIGEWILRVAFSRVFVPLLESSTVRSSTNTNTRAVMHTVPCKFLAIYSVSII